MTEYEAASLAIQQDTLAIQQATLSFQQASLAVQRAAVWVAALVGAAQCSLIGVGLYIMRRAAIQRDAMHQETIAALNAQREAQTEQHRETMAALDSRHRETMKTLENQNNAMMELIRRTSA